MTPQDFFVKMLSKMEELMRKNEQELSEQIEKGGRYTYTSYPFHLSIYFEEDYETGDMNFSKIKISILDAKNDNISINVLDKLKKSIINNEDFDIDEEYKKFGAERRRDFGIILRQEDIPNNIDSIDFVAKVVEKLEPDFSKRVSAERIRKDLLDDKFGVEYTLGWLKFTITKDELFIRVCHDNNIKYNIILHKAIQFIKNGIDFDLNDLKKQVEENTKVYNAD
jgi:hypothetical protein